MRISPRRKVFLDHFLTVSALYLDLSPAHGYFQQETQAPRDRQTFTDEPPPYVRKDYGESTILDGR